MSTTATVAAGFDWTQPVTWFLVILGWLIVNHQNNARELRKEQRAAVDAIKKQIGDLEEDALKFHSAPQFDAAARRRIQFRMHRISAACERLQLPDPSDTLTPITGLRRAITLKNADPSAFEQQPEDSMLLDEIMAASNELVDNVEARFAGRYFRLSLIR